MHKAKAAKTRQEKAEGLWAHGAVRPLRGPDGVTYAVHSENDPRWYALVVPPNPDRDEVGFCDCPDFARRGGPCKHQGAVELFLQKGKPRLKVTEGGLVPVADRDESSEESSEERRDPAVALAAEIAALFGN